MSSKTITIREEVYNLLLSIKSRDESFSQLFERLVKKRSNLEVLKELKGSMDFKDKEELMTDIRKKRSERRY